VEAQSQLAGASVYGLLHMAGNAREWCHDRYGPRWYRFDTRIDPRGPASNGHRVVRGGSYATPINSLVMQTREHAAPAERLEDIGFRVARSWPATIH
jgi:iron(II)-dependent oxidoreductase